MKRKVNLAFWNKIHPFLIGIFCGVISLGVSWLLHFYKRVVSEKLTDIWEFANIPSYIVAWLIDGSIMTHPSKEVVYACIFIQWFILGSLVFYIVMRRLTIAASITDANEIR